MRPVIVFAFPMLVSVFVTGCAKTDSANSPAPSTQAPATALAGTQWTLIELMGEQVDSGGETPHLALTEADQRVSGFAGCNQFSGGYELGDDNALAFSQMIATRMACPDLDLESKFLQALDTVRGYKQSESGLVLKDSESNEILKFEAAQ